MRSGALFTRAQLLLVLNKRGVDALLKSTVKLGGDASVAAGPKGRRLSAATGASLRAEILSYAFARRVMRRALDTGFSLTSGADDLC